MKNLPAFRRLVAAFFLVTAGAAFAQNATLTADATALAPAGGQVTFAAAVSYDGQPSALGWAIALPADWTLVSVAGANVPEVSPAAGSTGALEFAYTAAPAAKAEFSVIVRYPAGTATAKAVPTVLVRANGKLATLSPALVEFAQ